MSESRLLEPVSHSQGVVGTQGAGWWVHNDQTCNGERWSFNCFAGFNQIINDEKRGKILMQIHGFHILVHYDPPEN